MQCACVILLSVACLHYLINGTILGKKLIDYKMCVLISSTNISRSKKN